MNEAAAVEAEETVEEAAPRMAKKVTGIEKDAGLTVLVDSNPKRAGSASYDRFEGYLGDTTPTTVQEALDAGLTMGDIKYDLIHGSIEVEGAEVVEYEVSPRGPRPAKDTDEDLAGDEADDEDLLAEGAEEQAFG
jgi:ADP-ribose pyrophosphatase YjhB (NUDIX family)